MSSTPTSTSGVSGSPSVIDALSWVHIENGRLLCVRSRNRDRLYLPGGKREPGESDEAAVARETREEVSVSLRPGTFERIAEIDQVAHDQPEGTRVRLICFTAEYDGEIAADNEVGELAWVGYADRALCAPAVRDLVDLLHERGLLT
ncbi:NUDIX hydrolase [Nocardiopsis alba]|uniref:NUDIX hydrolase n=1 Tax=Nocardiopsis alba TaxID=53437 RepID=UPI00034BB5FF|nr:NUDIX domain-containing protein [Nocardiopsis alba]